MKHLSSTAAEPDAITIRLNLNSAYHLGTKIPWNVALRDSHSQPLWLVHPLHGCAVDLAVLPIEAPPMVDMRPINEMPSVNMRIPVGSEVFILGFPLGIGDGLPIWKRGSVASEPQVLRSHEPILVDTATRPGMSGSPVISRAHGYVDDDSGVHYLTGKATRVIGVYSGRLPIQDAMDAQLGRVWQTVLIDEIIAGAKRDTI